MLSIKNKDDIIIVQFPRGEYKTEDLETLSEEMRKITKNPILFLPKDMEISILEQKEGNLFDDLLY